MRTPAYRLNFICQPTFTEVFVFRIDGRSKRRVYLHTFLRLPTFTGRSAKKAGIPSRRVAIISITVGIISMSMSVYLHKKRAYSSDFTFKKKAGIPSQDEIAILGPLD